MLELAQRLVPAATAVSVTVLDDAGARTAASTGAWADGLDRAQYDAGAGPCVDAAVGGELRLIADLRLEQRWPSYVATALLAGALSSVSVPVPVAEWGAASLNAYATQPDAFAAADLALLRTLAGMTAALMWHGEEPPNRSRAVVDQAKGMLMGDRHCSPGDALDVLAEMALASSATLDDVATDMVRTAGETRTGT